MILDTAIRVAAVVIPISLLFEYAMHILKKSLGQNGELHIINRIVSIFRIMFYSTILIMSMGLLGINIASYLAGAGFLGIVLGLAVQQPLSNFFSGIYLILTRMIRIGDRISINAIGSNIHTTGVIQRIGFSHTELLSEDGLLQVVPNNLIISSIMVKIKR